MNFQKIQKQLFHKILCEFNTNSQNNSHNLYKKNIIKENKPTIKKNMKTNYVKEDNQPKEYK